MLFTVVIIIILAVFINSLTRKYSFRNLIYSRNFTKDVVEPGEEFEIETVLENKKFLPVTFLQVKEEYPSIINYKHKTILIKNVETVVHTITLMLLPYQRVKRRYKVEANKRGRYLCKVVFIVVGDALGLTSYSRELSFMDEIVVLPMSCKLNELLVPYGDYNGDVSVKRWIIEDPVITAGIREYTGFEPQKNIHWPSSLKNGRLMVKKFDYTTDNKVMMVLNVETFKPFWMNIDHEKIEKCISLARAAAEGFEEEGIPYGFGSNAQIMGNYVYDRQMMPGWGLNHLNNILECLGRIDYSISGAFEEILAELIKKQVKYSTYVIITPVVLEEHVKPINILSNQCEKLVLIALSESNLQYLDSKIMTFVERGDDN